MYFRHELLLKNAVSSRGIVMNTVISCITAQGPTQVYFRSLCTYCIKIFEGTILELIKLCYQFKQQGPFEKLIFADPVRKFPMF